MKRLVFSIIVCALLSSCSQKPNSGDSSEDSFTQPESPGKPVQQIPAPSPDL